MVRRWSCPALVVVILMLAGCAERAATRASAPPAAAAATAEPTAIERSLFSVEQVMEHQAALGLDEAQTAALREALRGTETELVDLEWRLGGEKEALAKVLAVPRPDEAAAVAAAERVVRLEGDIKLAHLRLLVRVKNQLTPAQQAILGASPHP